MPHLPPLRLTQALTLTDQGLQDLPLTLSDGVISDAAAREIDLGGYWLLPGIIDLHGDGFERHLTPRPTAPFPLAAGLASFDREAAALGVTTAYIAQSWSWEGAHRAPERCETLLAALEAYRPGALTDLRVQIRAETHMPDLTSRLIEVVRRHAVDFVIFNDHLDEGLTMARDNPIRFRNWALGGGREPEVLMQSILQAQASADLVPESLATLARAFTELGVTFGSHDDPDPETRARFAALGGHVAEFPLNVATAQAARQAGSPVLMGAPNVVRGGSQSGNVAAADVIAAGVCDVLVSDYHLPALALSAWRLVDDGLLDFATAWAMISTRAAKVVGLSDRGDLTPGARADLVVMNPQTRQVEATIVAGRLAFLAGEAGRRFLG